jgi:hypothetical protein
LPEAANPEPAPGCCWKGSRCAIKLPCSSAVPKILEREDSTLVKLLDEYNWITITQGHKVPTKAELERWLRWI